MLALCQQLIRTGREVVDLEVSALVGRRDAARANDEHDGAVHRVVDDVERDRATHRAGLLSRQDADVCEPEKQDQYEGRSRP